MLPVAIGTSGSSSSSSFAPNELFGQARAFWQNANAPVRAALVGSVAFLLFLAVALSFWAGTPDFVPVFNGTPVEAQSVAREMDKAAIPYRLSDDGGQISVPRTNAGRARQVAGTVSGTAQSGLGLRGLDSLGPFTTYEQQRARIERAQEEAVEQQLAQYAGVQKATVNLALPEQSLRVAADGTETPVKAAVTLAPVPGKTFDEAQVAAMAHVVAHSVPNLLPQNVSIASTDGVTLWDGSAGASGTAGSNSALQTRTQAEAQYVRARQAELQASLDRVFGPNRAVVYVDASLDLDKQETDAKRVVPVEDGKGLPAAAQTTTEQYSGTGKGAAGSGGVVGTAANTPGTPTYPTATGSAASGSGTYKNISETTNYENTVENVHIVKAIGEPKRLNVSAMMDSSLPAATQAAIKSWIEGSVLNPTNQATTRVTVVAAPFDTTLARAGDTVRAASERRAWLSALAPYVVLPVCLVLLLLAAYLLTRKKSVREIAALPGGEAANDPALSLLDAGAAGEAASLELGGVPGEVPAGATALGAIPEGAIPFGGDEPMPGLLLEDGPDGPPLKVRAIREKVEPELEVVLDFIDSRPETAALLLRSWTTDEDRK